MRNKKGCILSFLLVFFILGVSIPLFMTGHTKVKADTITDLTNTTWLLSSLPATHSDASYSINFTTDNQNCTSFRFDNEMGFSIAYSIGIVYYGGWLNENYRTIEITGGTDATNSNLIAYLQNNATQQLPPSPAGTEILYKYWAPVSIIRMTNEQVIGDDDITYTILFNEFNRGFDETTQTGLKFYGLENQVSPDRSRIESIRDATSPNILYLGPSNNLDNYMLLEFTYGDYMDSELYDFMTLWGVWFDDADFPVYDAGMWQGYVEGEIHGRALGQADGTQYTTLVSNIFNGIGSLLSIQVFPNITIGLLIGLPLLLGVLVIILKILRG